MKDGKSSCVQFMARIRGLLLYYRSFFLVPGILLILCACWVYRSNAAKHLGILPAILSLKAIAFGMTAYVAHQRKERYYFFNLGLGPYLLTGTAFVIDFLLLFTALTLTSFFS